MEGKRWRLGDLELFTADCKLTARQFLYYDLINYAAFRPILERWLARMEYRSTLMDVCGSLGPRHASNSAESAETAISHSIESALKAGRLYILRRRSGAAANKAAEMAPKKKPQTERPLPAKNKTWIEIHLVDQDDQPVGNRQYRLKITDGSVRTGSLGSDGILRVNNIDPGTCEMSFLDIDATEWRPA